MSQFWSPAHMATFAKVIDLNGFSAAARALGVPKAAVSRAIAELEQELGVKLMTRTTRRLKLTPAGERLLPACRALERVIAHSHYLVPQWSAPTHRLAYNAWRLGQPPAMPPYTQRVEAWAMDTWWAIEKNSK